MPAIQYYPFFRGSQRQSGGGGTQPLDSWKRVSSRMAYVRFAYDHFGPSLVHVCPLKAARRVSSLAFFPTEQQGTLERGWRQGSFTGRSETPLFAGCTEKNHAPRRHRLWRPFLPFTFLYQRAKTRQVSSLAPVRPFSFGLLFIIGAPHRGFFGILAEPATLSLSGNFLSTLGISEFYAGCWSR